MSIRRRASRQAHTAARTRGTDSSQRKAGSANVMRLKSMLTGTRTFRTPRTRVIPCTHCVVALFVAHRSYGLEIAHRGALRGCSWPPVDRRSRRQIDADELGL